MLDDRSLTDASDEEFVLPAWGSVGMVHPLELDEATRTAWQTHLAEYEVTPPFPQLERPVVRVRDDRRNVKIAKDLEGTPLNAMTFKGRAEKLGWSRGSVNDAGEIDTYRKSFPSVGVEAFLDLEGFYIGIGMMDEIKLGDAYFVEAGSVKVGSYVYDNPSDASDPRLIRFGDVPPVVFSEIMGDLARIAGRQPEDKPSEDNP